MSKRPSLSVVLSLVITIFPVASILTSLHPVAPLSHAVQFSANAYAAYSSCTFKVYSGNGAGRTLLREERGGHMLNFHNRTATPEKPEGIAIWLGIIGDDLIPTGSESANNWGKKYGYPGPNGTAPGWNDSWKIESGQSISWCAPRNFVASRIWPRTGCSSSSGVFTCATGDCQKNSQHPDKLNDICVTSGINAGSIAEFTINPKNSSGVESNQIWYDLSFVDGYDFPIEIKSSRPTVPPLCPTVACNDNKLPDKCLTSPSSDGNGGDFVGGICAAPYIVYRNLPEHMYEPGANAISASCADPGENICGCAVECDGRDNRTGPNPTPRICPDTFTTFNPYKAIDVTLPSGGCSPVNKYKKVGWIPDPMASNSLIVMPQTEPAEKPERFGTFWRQMSCDPITKEGSFFAPYTFDLTNLTNPDPQGVRAVKKVLPETVSGTWEASIRSLPQITIPLSAFHGLNEDDTDNGTQTIPITDFGTIVTSQITVYVEASDTKSRNDKFEKPAIKVLNPALREVVVDGTNVTVWINDPDFIGKDYPVTVNIANKGLKCTPWPSDGPYAQYVKQLRTQCPGAYTYQFDDLVGLASCSLGPNNDVERFDITFHPRPAAAENHTKLFKFTPSEKNFPVTINIDYDSATQQFKTPVKAVGPDSALIALKDSDKMSIQTTSCPANQTCRFSFDGGSNKLISDEPSPTDWCTKLRQDHQTIALQLGINAPDSGCIIWDGKEISIIAQQGVTYVLKADGVDLDLTQKYTVPIVTDTKKTVDFSLLTTCSTPAGAVIVCNATYDISGRTFNLTRGSHTYCDQIFKTSHFPGTLTLLNPDPQFCTDPTWLGESIMVYPQDTPNGTTVSVPANRIYKVTTTATENYSVAMRIGDTMYLRVYADDNRNNAASCQATYNGLNNTNTSDNGFTGITNSDWCKNIFGLKDNTVRVLPIGAFGSVAVDAAYLQNVTSTPQKYYYSNNTFTNIINMALNDAKNGETIKSLGDSMPLFSSGITVKDTGLAAVTFQGGYTALTDITPAGYTIAAGPLLIRSGKLAVNRLKIR